MRRGDVVRSVPASCDRDGDPLRARDGVSTVHRPPYGASRIGCATDTDRSSAAVAAGFQTRAFVVANLEIRIALRAEYGHPRWAVGVWAGGFAVGAGGEMLFAPAREGSVLWVRGRWWIVGGVAAEFLERDSGQGWQAGRQRDANLPSRLPSFVRAAG